MLKWLVRARLLGVLVVIASMIGALILIGIGGYYTWEAIASLLGGGHAPPHVSEMHGAKLALLEEFDFYHALEPSEDSCGAHSPSESEIDLTLNT